MHNFVFVYICHIYRTIHLDYNAEVGNGNIVFKCLIELCGIKNKV